MLGVRSKSIRPMELADLNLVLDWAAAEGWNPGLDDAKAFLAADPEGFLIKEVDGEPVAAISVANHSDSYAFLGLYIVHPDHRKKGYGMEIWQAGLAHGTGRLIGLDAVAEQQRNYGRSGFRKVATTSRYAGVLRPGIVPETHIATKDDLAELIAADFAATGVERDAFLQQWFKQTKTRKTICLVDTFARLSFATIRKCREGMKIGPFYADDGASANKLLAALAEEAAGERVMIDIPDGSLDLVIKARKLGLVQVFETARMYFGKPPVASPPDFLSVATLELG